MIAPDGKVRTVLISRRRKKAAREEWQLDCQSPGTEKGTGLKTGHYKGRTSGIKPLLHKGLASIDR
jgi:hypothetical protein